MKRIYFFLAAVLFTALAFAQDKGTDLNVNITKSNGASNFPWTWVIIGAVVLIVLVLALSGSRGGTDRVIEKKTIVKE